MHDRDADRMRELEAQVEVLDPQKDVAILKVGGWCDPGSRMP